MIKPTRPERGYTVLELLCAIVLILVVIALAAVGLRSLTGRTLGVQCLTNLKNLHAATMAYAADHDGEVPVDRNNKSTGTSWYMALKEGYLPHPGYRKRLPPYFCPANRPDANSGGNDGWTNYAINGNLYDGGTNMGKIPSEGEAEAHLAARKGPRLLRVSGGKALFLDSRDQKGAPWYTIGGPRYGKNYNWPNSYPVHEDRINVIFVGGHARSVRVFPRIFSPEGDLAELRGDWFWPLN